MRLSPLNPENLNDAQRAVMDAIAHGPRGEESHSIGLGGPFGVWVRAPTLGDPTQALGAAVRFSGRLPDNVREVAICTVGHFHRARYEVAVHMPIATEAGVSLEKLEKLCRDEPPGFTGDEEIAHEVAQSLLGSHRLDEALYRRAIESFGDEGTIELVLTIGYYCVVSHTLNAFEIPLADGMRDPYRDS